MTTATEGGNLLVSFSNTLAEAIAQAGTSVVTVNARPRKASSGIHWRAGLILTADYTIKREDEITITLPSGKTVPATLVGRDAGTDLAVLRIEDTDLPVATIGDTASLKVGHLVLAIGRSGDNGLGASMGVISALGGSWRSWYGGQIDQFVRPDLTLYPGFSGGPLIDTEGRVVGMNTTGPRNMALTIPTATIQRVITQLTQRGRIARGYLGVGMQPVRLPQSLVQGLGLPDNGGVIVVSVEPDSPADRAGVLIGDVVVSLGDTPISDVRDVFAKLDPDQVGKPLAARVIRGGTLVEVAIVVGERPMKDEG